MDKKLIITTPKGSVMRIKTNAGTVTAKIEWNPSFGKDRTSSFNAGQARLDSEIMRLMEPYMQMVSGAMIMSMRLSTTPGSGEIIVNTPYARKVYYSRSAVGRPTGPLRGPRYFERMKADKKSQIRRFTASHLGAK